MEIGGLLGHGDHVTMKGVEVDGWSIFGGAYVGGLVGRATDATILDASVTDAVLTTSIEGANQGGIAGGLDFDPGSTGTLTNLTVTRPTFAGTFLVAGGAIGSLSGAENLVTIDGATIDTASATPMPGALETTLGGIIGISLGYLGAVYAENLTIKNSTVTGSNLSASYVGGVMGRLNAYGTITRIQTFTVKDSSFTATANAPAAVVHFGSGSMYDRGFELDIDGATVTGLTLSPAQTNCIVGDGATSSGTRGTFLVTNSTCNGMIP
jgi:hypothetical protein